jgi:hypothetical protein
MLLSDTQLLAENPSWRLVLQTYLAKTLEAAEERVAERKREKAAAKQSGEQVEGEAETDDESADAEDESTSSTEDRWLTRIDEVQGVDPEELSSVHGRLIAHGFLKFKLAGREGLVYQLTSLGRRMAQQAHEDADNECDGLLDNVAEDELEEAA